MNFSLISSDINNSARLGKISTDHSTFETPVFMPIGTSGAIKTIDPDFLHDLEISIKSNSAINKNILFKKLLVDICNTANS